MGNPAGEQGKLYRRTGMEHKHLKKILACCSLAGLLTATAFAPGCSKQEETDEKTLDQETSQPQTVIEDDGPEKAKKPDGSEVRIRGKSG